MLRSSEPSLPYRQAVCLNEEQYPLFCAWRARIASEEGKKLREIARGFFPCGLAIEKYIVDKISDGDKIVCVASEYFGDFCACMDAIGHPILGGGTPVVLLLVEKQLAGRYDTSKSSVLISSQRHAELALWLDREQKLTGQSRDSLVFEAFVPEWEMDIATVDLDSYQCYTIRASAFERGYKLVRFGSGVYERFEAYVNDNPVISGVGTPISVLAEAVAGMAMRPIWAVGSWLAGLGGFSAKSHSD